MREIISQDIKTPTSEEKKAGNEPLITPDFMRKLERLTLALSRVMSGRMHGERRSTHRGSSVEFADFRDYTHGDDLRYVDWNAYARLEKLFIKLFVEEEDLQVHLLIDISRSMSFGTPSKLQVAKRLCAALGYIALANMDRVSLTAINEGISERMSSLRGKGSAPKLFSWLEGLQPSGATQFARSLRDYSLLAATPGMLVIVSDCLAPGLEEGMRSLAGRKFAPTLIQLLAPEELNPEVAGDIRLLDAETGETREVTVTRGLLQRYQRRLVEHRAMLEGLGNRYGVNFISMSTAEPFDDFILRRLKMRKLLA